MSPFCIAAASYTCYCQIDGELEARVGYIAFIGDQILKGSQVEFSNDQRRV